ncbi:MAG: NACHT domain-containing NTPase, partial [Chroococcidiopsidaceae cyanobacterium CP_BM_RX_35]|nr:NACHT domain-containing NTPase [Chroococcidiopsidaceae cyanobacterium CP_BM_RX_35]
MMVRARRSLKALPEGIKRANKAVLSFATKIDFAAELEISRATVQNFFAGKPVGRENFHKICQVLELPWQEIADLPEDTEPRLENEWFGSGGLDALVQEARQRLSPSIQQCCGLMRVLDMSQPVELNNIYTRVNVLEKISGRRRLEVADLLKVCLADEFERPNLGGVAEERLPGLEAIKKYSKLVVLGKPGAGKTTFLKHIALQCSSGQLQTHLVPLFITLKDFAESEQQSTLLEYVKDLFAVIEIVEHSLVEQLLSQGKMLVLLDGLDEVRETDCCRVLQEIRKLSNQFHASHFIITCRIATREYTLEQFTEVEITDFDSVQIATFATKWFAAKDPIKGKKFVQKLKENRSIQELSTNPLLLTLLCLVFEESVNFPVNRLEIYKEGLSVLLRKWDAKRNIEREQVYKKLSLFHKEELLSQIARLTFERGDYFFRQKEVELLIADYIRGLPDASAEPETLQLDSEAVLKSIEAQHGLLVERARGIYSFSHL